MQNGCMASLGNESPLFTEHDLQLCDAASVAKLLEAHLLPKRRSPRPVRGENLSEVRVKTSRPRRCNCGTCSFCIDNLRWDRIFDLKFADPTYYHHLLIRYSSSLASLA